MAWRPQKERREDTGPREPASLREGKAEGGRGTPRPSRRPGDSGWGQGCEGRGGRGQPSRATGSNGRAFHGCHGSEAEKFTCAPLLRRGHNRLRSMNKNHQNANPGSRLPGGSLRATPAPAPAPARPAPAPPHPAGWHRPPPPASAPAPASALRRREPLSPTARPAAPTRSREPSRAPRRLLPLRR